MALPASMRLRGQRCFSRLHRSAKRFQGRWMVLRVMREEPALLRPQLRTMRIQRCRCALVISNKVSKRAVRRNRLRRLLHRHLRTRLEARADLAGLWLLITKLEALNRFLRSCSKNVTVCSVMPEWGHDHRQN